MPAIAPEILAIAKEAKCNIFVESGTFKGKTFRLAIESEIFERHYSVEIVPELYNQLKLKFPEQPDTRIFLGNSSTVFTDQIFPLCSASDRIFFWLDGHFSAGETGGADMVCPLLAELEEIYQHCPTKSVVIAIDDTDDFGRSDSKIPGLNWNTREEIEIAARKINSNFRVLDYTQDKPNQKLNRGILVFSYM